MSDDKTSKSASGAFASLLYRIPGPHLIIEWVLALALLFIFAYSIVFVPKYLKKLVESSAKAPESCWELREIQKAVFRFNKCTGRAIKLELSAEQAPARQASMPQKFSTGQPAKAEASGQLTTPSQQAPSPRKFSTKQSTSPEQ